MDTDTVLQADTVWESVALPLAVKEAVRLPLGERVTEALGVQQAVEAAEGKALTVVLAVSSRPELLLLKLPVALGL